jgi:hypothetical protein
MTIDEALKAMRKASGVGYAPPSSERDRRRAVPRKRALASPDSSP